jgi:hypothetical protein
VIAVRAFAESMTTTIASAGSRDGTKPTNDA